MKAQELSTEEWNQQYLNTPEKLRKIWDVELDLFDQFIRVCEKNHLRWFVDGGTLLGAVRHQGFIPWDDDIDIIMPLKDYKKLCSLSHEFSDLSFLQSYETEDGFEPFMMKLRSRDTIGYNYKESFFPKEWNKGIAIDIFALVPIPDSIFLEKLQLALLKGIRLLLHGYVSIRDNRPATNYIWIDGGVRTLYRMASFFLNYKALDKLYMRVGSWEKQWTNKCGPILFIPGVKMFVWKCSWYKKAVKLDFMGRKVFAPSNWHERLLIQYGDYMTPRREPSMHGELYM